MVRAGFADSLILLVLDGRVPYLGAAADSLSLLTLPLGDRSLLDHLAGELTVSGQPNGEILVAPCFPTGPSYEAAVRRSTRWPVRVVPLDRARAVLTEHEPSDDLLLVDARYWPAGGYDLAALRKQHGEYRGVTHVIAIGGDPEGTHEWVARDTDGRVKGVQRFYDGVTWPQVANSRHCLSLLSARVVGPPPRFSCLRELRSILAGRGMLQP